MAEGSKFAKLLEKTLLWIGGGLILLIIAVVATTPSAMSSKLGPHNFTMQVSRAIGQVMFSYAEDHNGAYPTGKSSTEVFQKLIDAGYVNDPSVFWSEWVKVPGKTKATSNILKAENVCWDVTIPADSHSDDSLPLVFLTGYRIEYVPHGSATPLFPWAKEWTGIAVFYKGNNAAFLKNDGQPDGMVTNFISQAFEPAGKKYQQLTPDGPLAP